MRDSLPPARMVISTLLFTLLLVSCTDDTVTTSTNPPATTSSTASAETTTTSATTTTTDAAPTTTPAEEETVALLLAPFSEMGPGWAEQVFPYGDDEETLGTSPGGEGLLLGPEYGTQTPDRTWWFLDAAKQRIAHFSDDGNYLDRVMIPEALLVDGVYFQYQLPQALDNGSIVASGWRAEDTTSLLRIEDGTASGVTFDGAVPWVTTEGRYLYGQTVEGDTPYRLDPDDPIAEPVDWFLARDGSRYMVTINEDEILVELPDAAAPLTRTLQMRFSEDPEVIVRGAIQVETGADGTLFILIYGIPMADEMLDVGAIVTISPDGEVSQTEVITSPFSASDPGSPAHLGVTPGTSTPWMMVVDEDGVHVFTLSG